MNRVAAYIRVSTQEQKLHGLSLEAQKMKLTEYADKHELNIVAWYMDEGVSGRKLIKNRPALQEMIRDAEAKKFDRILFIKLDRFFRSVAEYHECMKRISPVTWTATEEDYDLTTANGRMLVNMKLTIAELEADQTGERIRITNDYKVKQGSPLTGSVPFCFKIVKTPDGKRIVKNPKTEAAMYDLLKHLNTHQSKRAASIYLLNKHGIKLNIKSLAALISNPMLCGEYRGNPNYCEPYISKQEFIKLQRLNRQNIKLNSKRVYIFSGLLRCYICGAAMCGNTAIYTNASGKHEIKHYRCTQHRNLKICPNNRTVNERKLEKLLLTHIEPILNKQKSLFLKKDTAKKTDKRAHLLSEMDRLNYAWQKGRIEVSEYDKQYAILSSKLKEVKQDTTPDLTRAEEALKTGWKDVYENLSDENKRAFWRSFIKDIRIKYDGEIYKIHSIKFL